MTKLFLITYDREADFDNSAFHVHILSLYPTSIKDWWHYLQGTYIVASNLDADALYKLISPGMPEKKLLIIEVSAKSYQGWLNPKAWKWLRKYK